VWGSTATYETGDPLPKMRQSTTPPYLRVLYDVLTGLPFQEMQPTNDAVTPANVVVHGERWRTNFALGKSGDAYLVYSLGGGAGKITLAAGGYTALRVDTPRERYRDLQQRFLRCGEAGRDQPELDRQPGLPQHVGSALRPSHSTRERREPMC